MKKRLGICVGATSVKVTLVNGEAKPQSASATHHGDVPHAVSQLISEYKLNGETLVLATGTEGRKLLNINSIIEAQAVESAIAGLGGHPDAVVSLGGEDFAVYTICDGRIENTFSGDKCASGTGEFFRQQLLRMDMTLEDANAPELQGKVCGLSTRCSVFMKSDCTHRLNKGEATKADIVVSLVFVMATKISEFLAKARITKGVVWLVGGVTHNRHLVGFLRELMPDIEFVVPEYATMFESLGVALLADQIGQKLPQGTHMFKSNKVDFETYPSLHYAESNVRIMSVRRGKIDPDKTYVLGVDGGSTTTKVALVDPDTLEICASHYGRTHGNPVEALRKCLKEVVLQVEEATGRSDLSIKLCSATGSSRELLGAYLGTPGVYNEIIAHATATSYFDAEIDTIFEIGGQDAKYVFLRNGVPIDYAMNEACSAGTGSFLEEAAHSDLDIHSAPEIGPVALKADYSLKFGEHCSAFINSDIRKAIQQGAPRESIVGGLVHSIVSNYLNRVLGNRRIGAKIALQGGVAKNPAVPLAFASILGKNIMVPPEPELLGAFGVGLMAMDKKRQGLLDEMQNSLQKILSTSFDVEREFKCKACENACPIKVLRVGDKKSFFGGRCNKYTNIRKNINMEASGSRDYVKVRDHMLFHEYAPSKESLLEGSGPLVGVPLAFTVYSHWPMYATFFKELGARVVMSEKVKKEGIQYCESAFCYPGEIAHGAFSDLLDKECDFFFLPHIKMMPTYTDQIHACFCPVTQGLPYYLRGAFNVDDSRVLRPVIRMEHTFEEGRQGFVDTAVKLGKSAEDGHRAFNRAVQRQNEFMQACADKGKKIVAQIERDGRTAIVLLGRPYNAFAPEANMEIPRKIHTRGYDVIPFDFLPIDGRDMTYNMYYYYGQQDVSTGFYIKKHSNLFPCYVSNFSCGPDAFLLHIVHWIMGIKPYLVLEIDSHTADAGVDTRIEAFLDIIEGYRKNLKGMQEKEYKRLWDVSYKSGKTVVRNNRTGEVRNIRDRNVTVVVPSMGRYSSELVAATLSSIGIKTRHLPVADVHTTQLARNVASGKECIPTLLVLGSTLRFLAENPPPKDEVYVIVVPKTTGPCRTGQYAYFYERTFEHIGLENVALMDLSSDNSYNEMGKGFTKPAFWSLVIADLYKDMETGLRILAKDKDQALARLEELWQAEIVPMFREGCYRDKRRLARVAEAIRNIPTQGKLEDLEKVLVVGEIYVRRDDFSVTQLLELLSEKKIFGKIAGVIEWIYYVDYVRNLENERRLKAIPIWRRYFSKAFLNRLLMKVEFWYKHKVEHELLQIFGATGLIPSAPHNMSQVMKRASSFTDPFFSTEATVSSCVGAEAMAQDFAGIVCIAPFACLPGRLIKALLNPYMRKHGYPFIALENDGFAYPPALLSRIEVFMLGVLRYGRKQRGLPDEIHLDTRVEESVGKAEEKREDLVTA